MQKEKIDDLEVDLKELKYLLEGLDKEPVLARSAKRLIDLMKQRLDEIKDELDCPVKAEQLPVEEKTSCIGKDDLAKEETINLEEIPATPEVAEIKEMVEIKVESLPIDEVLYNPSDNTLASTPVLGEQLRPALELRQGLTLNDTFRFSRELFGSDKDLMNKVLQEISTMQSLAEALSYLSTHVKWEEENDATQDFIELLKKYFV